MNEMARQCDTGECNSSSSEAEKRENQMPSSEEIFQGHLFHYVLYANSVSDPQTQQQYD
jgi:hypothetical protein